MFKGFKEFTYKMIAGANVATIVVMLLVGFSDLFAPESFPALANVGLLFPVFLVINLGFLLFWLLFRSKYALIPFLGFVISFVPVRKYMPLNIEGKAPKDASRCCRITPGTLATKPRMPMAPTSAWLTCKSRMPTSSACKRRCQMLAMCSR